MKAHYLSTILFIAAQALGAEQAVREATCRIPVINDVDVVVAGWKAAPVKATAQWSVSRSKR
jgi:hypothetical protein